MTVVINGTSGITDVNGTAAAPAITGTDTDTGVFFGTNTVSLSTGGTERLQVDSSGNAGLGVTPSAWGSGFKAFENQGGALYSGSPNAILLGNNFYYNGTNNIYKNTNLASAYSQNAGVHAWYYAASGTAGNAITFTQAMTLDASGNLGIGTSSPSDIITLAGGASGSYGVTINNSKVGGGTKAIFQYDADNSIAVVGGNTTNGLAFKTLTGGSLTEKARIDSSGRFTLPYQPSFLAYQSTSSTTTTGPATILFNSVSFNIGSCYNGANGRFTAPVAGRYLFCRNQQSYSSSNQEVMFYVNGAQVADTTSCYSVGANGNNSSIILNLNANDYVTVYQYSGTSNGDYTNFSGTLLG